MPQGVENLPRNAIRLEKPPQKAPRAKGDWRESFEKALHQAKPKPAGKKTQSVDEAKQPDDLEPSEQPTETNEQPATPAIDDAPVESVEEKMDEPGEKPVARKDKDGTDVTAEVIAAAAQVVVPVAPATVMDIDVESVENSGEEGTTAALATCKPLTHELQTPKEKPAEIASESSDAELLSAIDLAGADEDIQPEGEDESSGEQNEAKAAQAIPKLHDKPLDEEVPAPELTEAATTQKAKIKPFPDQPLAEQAAAQSAELPSSEHEDSAQSPTRIDAKPEIAIGLNAPAPKLQTNNTAPVIPPAPPLPPEQDFAATNHDRIVSSVRSELLPTGGTMRMRLDPPELGVLQVMVRMEGGAMTATFETSNDQATKLLSHSLGQLKQVLETQGISVEKLHVQQSPRDQEANAGRDGQQRQSPQDEQSAARQEQQRREMLNRMWRRLRLGRDPLDMVA